MVKADRVAQKAYEGISEYMERQVIAGTIDELNTRAKHFGKALSMDLQEKILRLNYTESNIEDYVARYRKLYREGNIRYLLLESAENATETRMDNPLFEMLSYTITDDNVLEHSFLVEYNSVTGEVMAVFYSSEIDAFTYEGDVSNADNVLMRSKELLTQKRQGYFGVRLNEIF